MLTVGARDLATPSLLLDLHVHGMPVSARRIIGLPQLLNEAMYQLR